MLLTQYFDVSQLSKIEVAFFLQTLDSQVQLLYLKKHITVARKKLQCKPEFLLVRSINQPY